MACDHNANIGSDGCCIHVWRALQVEPLPGSEIVIDGIDILRIGLSDLRANLTIIPQVRSNQFLLLETQTHEGETVVN